MKEFFAWIYDTVFGIFNNECSEIFHHLFNNGGYLKFGFSFILIPLVCWLLFYYLWRFPYGKIWHWVLWLVVTILIVSGITYGIANTEIFGSDNQALNELIADESTGYATYSATLPLKYALSNSLLTIAIGIIYSLFMKQLSKVQIHLPF